MVTHECPIKGRFEVRQVAMLDFCRNSEIDANIRVLITERGLLGSDDLKTSLGPMKR